MVMMQIIGFLKLTLSASDSEVPEQSEIDILKELAQDKCKYTEDCKITSDITFVGTDGDREYRIMEEKYFRMFEMMFRRCEPYKYKCAEEGKRVIDLRYLHDNGRAVEDGKAYSFRGKSPGKWLDYVIFYALDKRTGRMSTDIFLGVAIYSEFYKVCGKYRDTLFNNLFNLYIRRSILDNPEGFYDSIYAINGNREDLRGTRELALLERVMKEMLLKALEMLGLPFGFERENENGRELINLNIYEPIPCDLDGFCDKKDLAVDLLSFDNVVMERMSRESISDDYKKFLLTLIGMVRSGENIITAKCSYWIKNHYFSEVLRLVNTNRNLVGVTELSSDMNLEGMLEGIRNQLKYLEINFRFGIRAYDKVIEFINSLNGIKLKTSIYFCYLGARTMGALRVSPGVGRIISLKVQDMHNYSVNFDDDDQLSNSDDDQLSNSDDDQLSNPDDDQLSNPDDDQLSNPDDDQLSNPEDDQLSNPEDDQLSNPNDDHLADNLAMLNDPMIINLELYNCRMSLEEFLLNEYFRVLRNKLKVLEVTSVGSINSITDADLKSLRIERLHINMQGNDNREAVTDLDQLVNRDVITRKGFRCLFFKNVNSRNIQEVVDLRYKLGTERWPAILTNFRPSGVINADYTHATIEDPSYELHYS